MPDSSANTAAATAQLASGIHFTRPVRLAMNPAAVDVSIMPAIMGMVM